MIMYLKSAPLLNNLSRISCIELTCNTVPDCTVTVPEDLDIWKRSGAFGALPLLKCLILWYLYSYPNSHRHKKNSPLHVLALKAPGLPNTKVFSTTAERSRPPTAAKQQPPVRCHSGYLPVGGCPTGPAHRRRCGRRWWLKELASY